MWSFATHAGAGMAIAGLTATYYALARRNYQGERERMAHESGFGDGPQVNRLRKHADNVNLTSSHMLLKKELEELSALNGSGSGLNILYQHKNPIRQFHRSNFEITPIVSRVDTRPSTIYSPSEEEIGTSVVAGESVFGSDSNLADKRKASNIKDDTASDEHPEIHADIDDKPAVIVNVNGGGDVTDDKIEVYSKEDPLSDPNENEEGISTVVDANAKQYEPIIEKWKSVQDNQFLKRTPSPVCFFKNPGFGNRYAVNVRRKKEPTTPLVATLSSSKINVTDKQVEGHPKTPQESVPLSPSDKCQENSTQFILSPTLSKSNVSVCEDENPEKMLKRRRKFVSPATKTIIDTHPVEEVLEYNKDLRKKMIAGHAGKDGKHGQQPLIRLRADPENNNVRPPKAKPKVKRSLPPTVKEPIRKPEVFSDVHTEKLAKKETFEETEGKVFEDEKISEKNNDEPIEKLIADFKDVAAEARALLSLPSDSRVGTICTRTSSVVTEIPSNSWISLPVRIYTNSMRTLPWSLIGFCVLVVIIAGLLGIFLSRLANSITRRHQDGKM